MKKIFTLIVMLAASIGMYAEDTYVVAGTESFLGENWNGSSTENQMTTSDNGATYVLTKTGLKLRATSSYEFKIVKNGTDWIGDETGGNFKFTPEADGEYTVTFTYIVAENTVQLGAVKTGEASFEEQTWTVAGVDALCGSSWSPGDTSNDMTSTDGVNYTLVKEELALEGGVGYGFKVVADHDWGEAYPADNYMLTVPENGLYTVTFKFNKDTHEVSADAVKTGEASFGKKVWTIAGEEALMGSGWSPEDTNNDMTDMEDGTFQLVKKNVTLEAKLYTYKVVANHSWSENYGGDYNDGNAGIEIEAEGTYDVTFVWNPESKELYATADVADPAGITTAKNNNFAKMVIYNLQGQRVNAGFRGIVVKNGRKMLVK